MNNIKIKIGNNPDNMPQLLDGELAICLDNRSLYYGYDNNNNIICKGRIFVYDNISDIPVEPIDGDIYIDQYNLVYIYRAGEWISYKKIGFVDDLPSKVDILGSFYSADNKVIFVSFDDNVWYPIRLETKERLVNVASNYEIKVCDKYIFCDATNADISIILPKCKTCSGMEYIIKKLDNSAHIITIKSQDNVNIDGSVSYTLADQYEKVRLVSNFYDWYIV